MTRRRQLSVGATGADVDDLFDVLRDNLGRADAFITSVEELIERPQNSDEDSDEDFQRRRNHIEHLVEAAKLAVRAANYTTGELEAITQRRREA